ncbi:MAG: formate dehydrogenase accessory sulfurtransferase FdhD [Pseudomonadota bacterium]
MSETLLRPSLSNAGRDPTHAVSVVNEYGERQDAAIPGELPLTVHLEDQEIVTLMTLGTRPEELALGYVRNQRLIDSIEDIRAVDVDWSRNSVTIETRANRALKDWREKLFKRIVTSGCGQGTIFASTLEELDATRLQTPSLKQSELYGLIRTISSHNAVYRAAGAVHGCALCQGEDMLIHVEDVGRHNAADAISGHMWLEDLTGHDKIFYTTGRLTSEMVMKAAFMGVPVLLSRSGLTQMGLDLARQVGMTLIARAKGRHFNVYHGAENIEFDAIPRTRRRPAPTKGERDL